MSVWEAMELLNTFVDESDPDVRPHLPPWLSSDVI
jgi:hypothetical protein